VSSARELHRRGVAAINSGKVGIARQLLERALDATPDADTTARIEISLAYCLAETGDHASGLSLCHQALGRRDVSPQTLGLAHSQLGLLQMRAGATTEAFESFTRATELLGDDAEGLARAFLNRGGVYLQQGRHEAAAQDFAQATVQFGVAGLPTEEAKAQHNAGYALFLAGDLVRALSSMEAAYPVFATASPVLKAIAEQDRAETLLAAGMVGPGVALLRAAAATYGKRGLRQRQGEAELTLARSITVTEPAIAARAGRAASRHFESTGGAAWRIRADAVVLAAEVELGRRSLSLVTRGDILIRDLDHQGLYWGAASVRLHTTRVMIRRGDFDAARRRLGRVRMDESAPLAVRLLARDVRAELASAQGRRAAALMHLRQGLEELHAWQSSFGSLDLQTMVVGNGIRLAKQALVLAVESGRAEIVFEWSERARMLASRVQPVRAELDDQLAADLSELRSLQSSEDGPRIPSPRRDRDEELRQRVRERAWRLEGSGEVTEPASLPELVEALGNDKALVAWVATDIAERVTALVVTGAGARVVDLGPRVVLDELLDGLVADLDVAASELPPMLAVSVRAQLADRIAGLGSLLVTPLLELIGSRSLVMTPSGVLAGVPWTLLPGLVGRPLTQARSATRWLAHREGLLRTAGFVAGPRVERAEDEVSEAALCWAGSDLLVGPKATTELVSELAARVDVLHIAAHGRHSGDNPLFSGVECVDGPWFGYDIDQLETVPQVVVLSACEVGRSSVRAGDELIGMTAAWLHAGVGCVVASAAAVSDEVAHSVLTAFHRGLANGLLPEAALAAAVPAVSEDRPPAPFVCFR
jgi:tetratricopeptide (TPR) repeat protein